MPGNPLAVLTATGAPANFCRAVSAACGSGFPLRAGKGSGDGWTCRSCGDCAQPASGRSFTAGETAASDGLVTIGSGGAVCAAANPPLAASNSVTPTIVNVLRIDFPLLADLPALLPPTFPGIRRP